MIRDSLSNDNEYGEIEDVLTARNELDQEEDGLENAMFEVAKNSHDDNDQDDMQDPLGKYLNDGEINDAVGEDFMSEGSFREVVEDINEHMESTGQKSAHEMQF